MMFISSEAVEACKLHACPDYEFEDCVRNRTDGTAIMFISRSFYLSIRGTKRIQCKRLLGGLVEFSAQLAFAHFYQSHLESL